jgi:hypothetical protein
MEPLRFVERFIPPRMPVHRIVGMLKKIGTRLKEKAVGVSGLTCLVKVTGPGRIALPPFLFDMVKLPEKIIGQLDLSRKNDGGFGE